MSQACAVGLVAHTGWAWLVRVRATDGGPIVEARARVVGGEVLAAELYHRTRDHDGDRPAFLARHRAEALAAATEAVRPHLGGAGAAVVVGKRRALPALDAVVASHPLIHAAEGELWRELFAAALGRCGLAVDRALPGEARRALEAEYPPAAVEAWLRAARVAIGAPWGNEPQQAALAAWSALTAHLARPAGLQPTPGACAALRRPQPLDRRRLYWRWRLRPPSRRTTTVPGVGP